MEDFIFGIIFIKIQIRTNIRRLIKFISKWNKSLTRFLNCIIMFYGAFHEKENPT